MIDPVKVTDFKRSKAALEEFALFCVCAAGKNARQQAQKLDDFLKWLNSSVITKFGPGEPKVRTPFELLEQLTDEEVDRYLRLTKLGKYKLLGAAFRELSRLGTRLNVVDRDELTKIRGISYKTASFFILHSRKDQKIACLDTYVLKFLLARHPNLRVPSTSPQDPRRYRELESIFLGECMRSGHYDIAAADLACWNSKGATLGPTPIRLL